MKVFVVTSGIYDDYGMHAIFSTREKAEEYIKKVRVFDDEVNEYIREMEIDNAQIPEYCTACIDEDEDITFDAFNEVLFYPYEYRDEDYILVYFKVKIGERGEMEADVKKQYEEWKKTI
jgi:hypothetical protein